MTPSGRVAERPLSAQNADAAACRLCGVRLFGLVMLSANGVWKSPTLIMREARIREAEFANASDPRPVYIPAWMHSYRQANVAADANGNPAAKALSKRRHRYSLDRVREKHASGVHILARTDSPLPDVFPGWALHDEPALFVEAGLSPTKALQTATSNAGLFKQLRNLPRP